MTTDIADAFRVARGAIERGGTKFISVALLSVGAYKAHDVVLGRIAPYITLGGWLCANATGGRWPSDKELRLFSIRWLDHLIREFSQED